jgi:hypothetical protein
VIVRKVGVNQVNLFAFQITRKRPKVEEVLPESKVAVQMKASIHLYSSLLCFPLQVLGVNHRRFSASQGDVEPPPL